MSELAYLHGPADESLDWIDELVDDDEPDLCVDPDVDALPPPSEGGEAEPFRGYTHDEALALELPAERYLIDGLIPVGTVGTIAGVPETHKSFLAQAIATRCAAGTGQVLGFDVATSAVTGYFWQDDSSREELERIRLFEGAHASPSKLALHWFLNPGIQLPRDIERLVATVRRHRLQLAILDSFYNVAAVDLKDSDAELVVAQLKRDVADTTGCTVLIVDHMPWANESNRQRLRSYGGVFKNAATRFGIYIDANGTQLHIEARGNNIRGFKKRPAYWDGDTLELKLVDSAATDDEATDALQWLADYVANHHAKTGTGIARGKVETAYHDAHGGHGRNLARRVIDREIDAWNAHLMGQQTGEGSTTLATGPGEVKNGTYLYPSSHAPSPLAAPPPASTGEAPKQHDPGDPLASLATAPIGGEATGGEQSHPTTDDEAQRLHDLYAGDTE